MKEIASLPSERKLWLLRKYYAGGQGALPPTDPRIQSMTYEMIELEFEHMMIDKKEKGEGQVYADDSYDDYDNETEDTDNRLSDMPRFGSEVSDPHAGTQLPKPETNQTHKDEWEDVEIDDFDSEED